jgi:putative intracellular protease/amidase
MSFARKMTLSLIAAETGPVTAAYPPHLMMPGEPRMDAGHMLQPKITATHTFQDAPALDILLVPGGLGNVALEQANDTSVENFIALRFDQLDYLLSVCTGAASLAKSGVLKGRKATTNKNAWAWVTSSGEDIDWVPTARWVEDGKIWTSSGVAAGMLLFQLTWWRC